MARRSTFRSKWGRRRSGSSLVEFALVGTIMLSLSMGMLQFGVIMQTSIVLSQISRDAARWVVVNQRWAGTTNSTMATTCTSSSDSSSSLGCFVRNGLLTNTMIGESDFTNGYLTVSYSPTSGRGEGDPITIYMAYNMKRKFFLPTSFPGLSRFNTTVKTQTTMICQRS